MKDYLLEGSLGEYLQDLFQVEFIHDKVVPNSGVRSRPDYRNDKLKLIVEFDGYKHYTLTSRILADNNKDKIYSEMGYKIVRIPYFIQWETRTVKHYFNIDKEYSQTFPHGFIVEKSDGLIMPADFCSMGVNLFINQMKQLPDDIRTEVMQSLKQKAEKYNPLEVYPIEIQNYDWYCEYEELT